MTSSAAPAIDTAPTISEAGFDVLRSAINLVRDQGIQKVAFLRKRLLEVYPGEDALVQEALAYWGYYERSKGAPY